MSAATSSESVLAGLLRPFWMLVGNAVILLFALTIARLPPWTPSWRDGLFAVAVACLVGSRWADVTRYAGTTGQGDPMTRAMLVRWAVGAVVVCGVLWLLCQSVEL